MRDIRFISGDAESLLLETADGEKLRLTVDNEVREAVRKQPSNSQANVLSPREIQDAVRTGTSIEELVAQSGDSVDFVTKFATPVLEELEHMVASALAVRVEIEPDRFNEVRHREFGDLVTERLRNGGASSIRWSASRATPFTWMLRADFETMGGVGVATWTFDPRQVHLSPENETAVSLSSNAGFGDSPIPKLQSLKPIPDAVATPQEPKVTELLDAFKERREAAMSQVEVESTSEVEVVGEAEGALEVEFVEEVVEEVEKVKPEPQRKGRAPMPSWDEIVFGTKTED
jgi:lambda repressor-like predicted transcriptional regulator